MMVSEDKMMLDEGIDYWFGTNGKAFNMAKARDTFQKATEFGSAEAYYWLGDVRRYDQDAGRWPEVLAFYQKAVDKGSSYGYYGLGTLYETGYGVDKDVQKAIELYQKAADGGCLMGNVGLGNLYSGICGFDNGVAVDAAKAQANYTAALESEDFATRNAARVGLGDLNRYAIGAEADQAKALEWYQKAADEGYYLACRRVGDTYRPDTDIAESDPGKMVEWYGKEAAGGFSYSLGAVYMSGLGVEADPAKAREIFQNALDEGDRSAAMCMCGLVLMNANGIGQDRDKEAAIDWCYKAIDACGPFDDSDNPEERLHKPLPYARYALEHYGQPLERS